MTTVFISYSSSDRRDALAVRRLLANRGCTVWLDVFDIRVAAELKHELGSGIDAADVMCLLLSPTAVASTWVAEEIARATAAQAARRGLRLLPILIRPCRPPDALIGRVMLDATAGMDAPDVAARLVRAVLGKEVVDDDEIDAALQEALAARQQVQEAAAVLPELAQELDPVRDLPIRSLELSFDHRALARGRVLALSLTFDRLFSEPLWFVFAHYREERTWPPFMRLADLEPSEVRENGKRVDGRLQWFDRVLPLDPQIDGTDLRDQPATFTLELSGESFRPNGSVRTYEGGPGVPHLEQRLELPSLAKLFSADVSFGLTLLGQTPEEESRVELDENDYQLTVSARYESGQLVTLFQSSHTPEERAILAGPYLSQRQGRVEREAILGLYPKLLEIARAERQARRQAARQLLEKPDGELSPEERRVVGVLTFGRAQLEMFRVFGNSPPPGPARQALHERAVEACTRVHALLAPLALASLDIDDVGMTRWALVQLAAYHRRFDATRSSAYSEACRAFLREVQQKAPEEPYFSRWLSEVQTPPTTSS